MNKPQHKCQHKIQQLDGKQSFYSKQSLVHRFGYLGLAAVIYGVQALGKGLYLQSQKTVEHQQLLNN